jgi:GAF domain-containing protein
MRHPDDEAARQRVLDMYRVVDTLPESAYDDIVQLASTLCDTPIAMMSLIDRDRQWFKASRGLGSSGTRREDAFCAHAIERPGALMEIHDARADARFVDNPLVTGEPRIRFYAGMPLVAPGGAAIGTVCVIDDKPRQLGERQREGLAALARLTMTLLDARLHEQELERAAVFAEAAAAPHHDAFSVLILQVQGFAEHATRFGERTLERQLTELERQLGDALDKGHGDSVNRTSHSADFIAVLHGDDVGTARRLRACADAFSTRTGIAIASAAAKADAPDERIEVVYLRADEALTAVKDATTTG